MVPMRPEEYAAQQRTVREVRKKGRPWPGQSGGSVFPVVELFLASVRKRVGHVEAMVRRPVPRSRVAPVHPSEISGKDRKRMTWYGCS